MTPTRRTFVCSALAAAASTALVRTAWARGIFKPCSAAQALSFRKNANGRVGLVVGLNFGGVGLAADLACKNPLSPTKQVASCIALDEISWNGGKNDPIELAGRVSKAGRAKITAFLKDAPKKARGRFSYEVFEYDPAGKKYYRSFRGDELDVRVKRASSAFLLDVSASPSRDVKSPENYQVAIALAPAAAQELQFWPVPGKRIAMPWGG